MNTLIYELLVDKGIKRRITILNNLAGNNLPVSVDYLADLTNTSKRTLLQDVSYFNEDNPFDMQITKNERNELILESENPMLVAKYVDYISKDSPLFTVIEACYSGNIKSIEEIADNLFVSVTTLKKHLAIFKKILKDFNLQLQLSPLEITGDESSIRYFYFQYFKYGNDHYSLSIRKDQINDVHKVIDIINSDFGLFLNVDYNRLNIWLAIFEQRIKLRRYAYISENIMEKHRNSNSYITFKNAFSFSFNSNPYLKNLPESELIYAFITRLDAILYETKSVFFMDDYATNLLKYENCVNSFLRLNGLHTGIYNDLKITLQAYLSNTESLSDLTPYFEQINDELLAQVEKSHSSMHGDWYKVLMENKHTFVHTYEIAAKLTLITLSNLTIKKNILFSFTGEPAALIFYKSIALKITPSDMVAIFIFNEKINDHLIKKLSIDICIYNYILDEELTLCTSIRISNVPKINEWNYLLTKLFL